MTKISNDGECEAIVKRMWPHLDGALSEADRERVVRHLEECDACRSHFKFAREFLEAIHHAQPDEAEFSRLRDKVVAALAAEGFTG